MKAECYLKSVKERSASVVSQDPDVKRLLLYCRRTKNDLISSRRLHCWMAYSGLESLPLYADCLIRYFSSCSALSQTYQVFSKVQSPTAYTWNAIISAYAQNSHYDQAFFLFARMQITGTKPDRCTILIILKACSHVNASIDGKLMNMFIVEIGCESDLLVMSSLIHLYGKCGALDEARTLFDILPNPNVVTWGALINGYACYGDGIEALKLFADMQAAGIGPQKSTFLSALKACGKMGAAAEGRLIHDHIIRVGLHEDMTVTSALMDMYGKCIRLSELQKLFGDCPRHDAVSWASFISTYIEQGSDCCASDLLKAMGQLGIMPDQVLFLSLLRACVVMPSSEARIIHDCIIKANFETDQVVANCLVSMYAKIGCLQEAEITFRKVEVPDIISCSSMIFGYDHAGFSFLACELFEKMQEEGIHSDRVSFLGVLKAYGSLGAVRKGRLVHGMLIESGFESDVEIGNTLVDMYAKCGSLQEAEKVFDRLQKRDSISWQILFSGYIQHGNRVPLIRLLQSMQCEGLKPNDVVFMNALAGCSHAGLHEDGEFLFNLMRQEYNISPSVEHYNCMLDLHGRMGSLLKAKDMLQTMPSSVNFIGWSTLLNVCRSHGNSVLGSHCFMALSEVDPRDASSYMLMCSLLTSNS